MTDTAMHYTSEVRPSHIVLVTDRFQRTTPYLADSLDDVARIFAEERDSTVQRVKLCDTEPSSELFWTLFDASIDEGLPARTRHEADLLIWGELLYRAVLADDQDRIIAHCASLRRTMQKLRDLRREELVR